MLSAIVFNISRALIPNICGGCENMPLDASKQMQECPLLAHQTNTSRQHCWFTPLSLSGEEFGMVKNVD